MKNVIYLDHNATTPVLDEVMAAMLPYFTQHFGNASSKTHAFGWIAEQAVATAQTQVAQLINANNDEIIFTSGATESINTAIKGIAGAYGHKKNQIIACATEHLAVLDTLETLNKKGFEITVLPVNRSGQIDLEQLKNAITEKTLMAYIMHANNETGTIHPIKEIAQILHEHDVIFFCDATQSAGKIVVDVKDDDIDLLCLSAHKMYGPKGVGALYIKNKRPKINLMPLIDGGGHQHGMRSGTLNVTGIVGLGKACEIAMNSMWDDGIKISRLRTILEQRLTLLPDVFINGDIKNRLYNTTNICFKNKSAADLIKSLKNVAISNGSACASDKATASHVLLAMGLTESEAQSSIRFSFGKSNTMDEVEQVLALISKLFNEA
jgi:cysteine desulfurase